MEHVDEITSGYFISLYRELESYIAQGIAAPLKTVFIGGGTPTQVGANYLWWLIKYLHAKWTFANNHELTIEANPETLQDYTLNELYNAGVTRVSVGIQSTFDHLLTILGRNIDSGSVRKGLKAIERSRPQRLSFDLLYGIPGQTLEELHTDIERLMEYAPDHISLYQLTPEDGTKLGADVASGKTVLPSDEEALQMQDFVESRLERHGFKRYEISNYARNNAVCEHNVAVWNGESYLGVGVGASGLLKRTRYTNVRSLDEYFIRIKTNRPPRMREESLNAERRMRERIAFGLRMVDGVKLNDETLKRIDRCDDKDKFAITIRELELNGLIKIEESGIKPTSIGLLVNNRLAMKILG